MSDRLHRTLSILTAADPPLSLADAKTHLRVDHDLEDDDITALIAEATDDIEARTGRAFRVITARLSMWDFPAVDDPIVIPRPPLVSVQSLAYVDSTGASQTMDAADYTVDTDAMPGLIWPVASQWPSTTEGVGAVVVTFTAGAAPPERILRALKLWCDLEFNDHEPLQASRIERRIDSICHGLNVRDAGLRGIST